MTPGVTNPTRQGQRCQLACRLWPSTEGLACTANCLHAPLIGQGAARARFGDIGEAVQLELMERKGDLFRMALDAVPDKRLDDVIVMNVGDSHPVGYNLVLAEILIRAG